MPMADPRRRKQADWHGRWGCPRRRLRQSKAALRKPVVGMLAGPAVSVEALVAGCWGDAEWPVRAGLALA